MGDPMASKGVERSVARTLARIASAALTRPAQPTTTPVRGGTPADTAAVGSIATQLASRPPVDAERVEQIKRALANGTFPILPATIADRLMALRYDWVSRDAE